RRDFAELSVPKPVHGVLDGRSSVDSRPGSLLRDLRSVRAGRTSAVRAGRLPQIRRACILRQLTISIEVTHEDAVSRSAIAGVIPGIDTHLGAIGLRAGTA